MREDTYRHKGLRENLIEELRQQGITDEAVLKAIPREDLIKQLADEKIITKEQIYENTEYKNEEKGEVTPGHKKWSTKKVVENYKNHQTKEAAPVK